jgi:hypothetical protein
MGRVTQSVYRLATDWTVRDRIPVRARFFAHVQTGPGAHPASCTMGTGSLPGVKRPGLGADHPPPSSAEVKKGKSYTSIYPLGQFRPVTEALYLYCIVRHLMYTNLSVTFLITFLRRLINETTVGSRVLYCIMNPRCYMVQKI